MVPPTHRGGTGEPLVLLHGITMSWAAWRPVIGELERHHDVFAPTLAGHRGGAPWPEGAPFEMSVLVDALEAQLDAVGLETAHVMGNSLGGWAALELARRGRARSCVAFSPAGTWRKPRDLAQLVLFFKLALRLGTPDWLRRAAADPRVRKLMLSRIMRHAERIPADDVDDFFDDIEECTMIGEFLDGADADAGLAPFATLPCPIRIAWGVHDGVLPWPRYGEPLYAKLPGADFRSLPGCGHVPMWDDPELVVRATLQVTAPHALTAAVA